MDTYEELLSILKGNQAAADMATTFAQACHLWDDIVDDDAPIDPGQADKVFLSLLLDLPRNPFFQRYYQQLLPAFECAVHSWFASRELERSDNTEDQIIAHVARFNFSDFISTVVALACGRDYALEQAARIRLLIHQESFAEFQAELAGRNTR